MAQKAKTEAKPKDKPAAMAAGELRAERRYPVGKLRENCRKLFGVSASTFDGATLGMGGEYTVEEMKKRIRDWGSAKGVR